MNIQAMMKQAQKLQKEMMDAKEQINKQTFVGTSSFVTVEVNGNKEILKVMIDTDSIGNDEIEMLQDMILIATNDAMKKVDKETESKMGKFTQGMPGLL
ncbi:MAG: YbaB/EbfC family nucleoid-associated protein [Bacilli bacterium]|nr:YbaB/EbfC family nucleoid-associated protein [Bacilli bacterium]